MIAIRQEALITVTATSTTARVQAAAVAAEAVAAAVKRVATAGPTGIVALVPNAVPGPANNTAPSVAFSRETGTGTSHFPKGGRDS